MVKLLEDTQYTSIPKTDLGDLHHITCYSEYHDGWAECESTATLRYFVKPRLQQDLGIGYDGWVAQHSQRPPEAKPFGIKSLDYLIEACLHSENSHQLLNAHVITKRGILFKLSQEKRESRLTVCLIDGILFIEEYDAKPAESRLNPLMHIGHAFKEACTTGPRCGDWSAVVVRFLGRTRWNVLF